MYSNNIYSNNYIFYINCEPTLKLVEMKDKAIVILSTIIGLIIWIPLIVFLYFLVSNRLSASRLSI